MSVRRIFRKTRTQLAAPLLGWALLIVVCCFLLWIVFDGAAHAGDPKAAARAIGNAGTVAATAIARDASNAATVPGYAGTNVPERPAVPVTAGDPGVARGKAIAADPQNAAHGAGNLASGSVSDCGADLPDANRGGSCGQVTWCVGAGCETVAPEANTGFVEATTRLNMALELGGDEFDRDSLRFFAGKRRACHIKLFGLANCCRNSGILVGLGNCSASERELAKERHAGNTHYLGRYCSKRTFFGACIRRSRAWCVFGSKLGRILHQQARPQLGIGWGSCRGFTVAEVERIDFARLDLSEFTQDLMDGSREPAVTLPEAGPTQSVMRDRVRDFYGRSR